MTTFTEFIETPEAYTLDTVILEHPQFLDTFIEYLTVPQNPLLCNERQCYLYPNKVADILSVGMSYRHLVEKKQLEGDKVCYPFLEKLFHSIYKQNSEATLLGYCSKILISLVKKTPQIYEFIKDNQQLMIDILNDDSKLDYLRQFISLLLVESTMEIYIFLKTMLIRTLIFRIVENQNVGVLVFRCITYFYKQIAKALEDASEQEKEELNQVCKLFEQQNFITLLILKLDSSNPSRNNHITQFLCMVCPKSKEATEIITLHIDSILDYLEQYQESQHFMEQIKKQHICILNLLVQLVQLDQLNEQLIGQLTKRLLVYSNVHSNNTLIHNLLLKTISCCMEQGKGQLLHQLNIIAFFIQNTTQQHYGFMTLRRRIFQFWIQHNLDSYLNQEEKEQIRQQYTSNRLKIEKSIYYRQFVVGPSSEDLGSTKVTSELTLGNPTTQVPTEAPTEDPTEEPTEVSSVEQ